MVKLGASSGEGGTWGHSAVWGRLSRAGGTGRIRGLGCGSQQCLHTDPQALPGRLHPRNGFMPDECGLG